MKNAKVQKNPRDKKRSLCVLTRKQRKSRQGKIGGSSHNGRGNAEQNSNRAALPEEFRKSVMVKQIEKEERHAVEDSEGAE